MKVVFNGKDVQMKLEQQTQLTKKQVEKIKLYAKAKTLQLINQNKIK